MDWVQTVLLRLLSLRRRWLGCIAGCVVWVLWMIFGFWAMVLLAVLAGGGYWIGLLSEQRKSWRDVVEKLLSERYTE